MKPKTEANQPTDKPDRAKPDKSKEAKLARALDALRVAATAYFDDGETRIALALRDKHAEIVALTKKTEAA